ncbi:MAG: hypothetical protein NVSMB5_02820 [Candidatus Velthaea sp.]
MLPVRGRRAYVYDVIFVRRRNIDRINSARGAQLESVCERAAAEIRHETFASRRIWIGCRAYVHTGMSRETWQH